MGRWCLAVVLCLVLLACTESTDETVDESEGPPPAEPLTAEEYVAASHEACEHYLGALFALVEADEQVDITSADASAEVFRRRAGDIAELYVDYRSRLEGLRPPDALDAPHDELIAVQGEHVETLQALGAAHRTGDAERVEALVAESMRLESETAALQSSVGIHPCGQ